MSKLFERSNDKPSLESIEFQSDSYAKDLEGLFSKILEDIKYGRCSLANVNKHYSVLEIEKLTFKRTGLKVELISNGPGALSVPFYPNQYSTLISKPFKGTLYDHAKVKVALRQQIKLIDKALEHRGTVDLKNCRVSGLFSEYVNLIYVNLFVLNKLALLPSEVTAIFLHELGHCFTAFEYSNRINDTNQVLAHLLRKTLETDKLSKEYIFKELKIINQRTTSQEVEKIISGKNIVLGRATMRYIREVIESQLPNNKYDETSNETLSDIFVSRWGYGKQMITALDKTGEDSQFLVGNSLAAATTVSITSVSGLIVLGTLITGLLVSMKKVLESDTNKPNMFLAVTSLAFITLYIVYLFLKFLDKHSRHNDEMNYDDIKYRYTRVRNQIVEMLKESQQFSKEQTLEFINQIKAIDDIIDERGKYKNVLTMIVDFFKPSSREIDDDIKLQRLLEALSANDLYIKAASLKLAVN